LKPNETQDQLPSVNKARGAALSEETFAFISSFIIHPSAFVYGGQRLAAALG
jgi:hypothetical protein